MKKLKFGLLLLLLLQVGSVFADPEPDSETGACRTGDLERANAGEEAAAPEGVDGEDGGSSAAALDGNPGG